MEIDPIDQTEPVSFSVSIDGAALPGAVSVVGLALEKDAIETKQQRADGTFVIRRLPGRVRPGSFGIRMPLTADTTIVDWFAEAADGADARRIVVLRLDGPDGAAIRSWTFSGCWCSGYAVDALSEGRSIGATLTATISYDEAVVS